MHRRIQPGTLWRNLAIQEKDTEALRQAKFHLVFDTTRDDQEWLAVYARVINDEQKTKVFFCGFDECRSEMDQPLVDVEDYRTSVP